MQLSQKVRKQKQKKNWLEKLVCFFGFVDYEQWSAGESALVPLLNTMSVADMIGIDFGAAFWVGWLVPIYLCVHAHGKMRNGREKS